MVLYIKQTMLASTYLFRRWNESRNCHDSNTLNLVNRIDDCLDICFLDIVWYWVSSAGVRSSTGVWFLKCFQSYVFPFVRKRRRKTLKCILEVLKVALRLLKWKWRRWTLLNFLPSFLILSQLCKSKSYLQFCL